MRSNRKTDQFFYFLNSSSLLLGNLNPYSFLSGILLEFNFDLPTSYHEIKMQPKIWNARVEDIVERFSIESASNQFSKVNRFFIMILRYNLAQKFERKRVLFLTNLCFTFKQNSRTIRVCREEIDEYLYQRLNIIHFFLSYLSLRRFRKHWLNWYTYLIHLRLLN